MPDTTLKAIITGSAAGAVKAFQEAELAADSSGKKIGDHFDAATSRVGSAFHGLAGTVGTVFAPAGMALDAVGKKFDDAQDKSGSFFSNLSTVGGVSLAAGAAGLATLGGKSLEMAGNFQQSMTQLVTGAGEAQGNIKTVSNGILDMAGQVGTSAQQLASGMYMIESAGFHGSQGLQVLKASAEGAKVGNADLATVSDALTSVLNAYQLKGKDATSVTNQLVATVAAGKMHMQDLAGALSAVVPTAAAAHIQFSDVGAAIATMTAQGTSAQQASQDLANTIRNLQNPLGPARDEMEQLGLNVNDVSTHLGRNGLSGTMEILYNAIASKMGPAGTIILDSFKQSKSAAGDAKQMFDQMPPSLQALATQYQNGTITAKDWRTSTRGLGVDQQQLATEFAATLDKSRGFNDVLKSGSPAAQTFNAALDKVMGGSTGLNTALQLTGSHMDTFVANTASVFNAGTRTKGAVDGWKDVQKDFNFQMEQAKASAQSLAIRFGDVLMPMVTKAMHAVQEGVGFLEKHKAVAAALAGVIGGVLAVAIGAFAINMGVKFVKSIQSAGEAIGKLGSKIVEMIPGFGEAQVAEEEFAATSEETGAASSMAFGPVGIAIMAIVAVGTLVVTHWQTVKHLLEDAWNGIKTAALAVWNFIKDHIKTIIEALVVIIMGPIGLVAVLLYKYWDNIKSAVVTAWNDIVHFFEGIPDKVINALSSLGSKISGFIANVWTTFRGDLDSGVDKVISFFTSLPGNILNALTSGAGKLLDWGGDIISGIASGISGAASKIFDAIKGAITSGLHSVHNFVAGIPVIGGAIASILPFAEGGYVTKPTLALVGEAGPEYVIPESWLKDQYNAGTQAGVRPLPTGLSAVGATAPITSSASATAQPASGAASPTINITGMNLADPQQTATEIAWLMRTAPLAV